MSLHSFVPFDHQTQHQPVMWIKYHILGIVCGRKLSRITFINVVRKKTFAGSPILRLPITNYLHERTYIRFASLFLQIPSWEGIAIMIDQPQLANTLANTLSKPSSMATLARSLACPDRVFCFSATTNNNGKASGHARLYLTGRFLCLIL